MKTSEGVLDPLGDPTSGPMLTRAIIDTIHEPLIVLDGNLRIIAASRSFYATFLSLPDDIQGKLIYEIGNGEWNIEPLKLLLEKIIPEHSTVENYEVEHDFPSIGRRIMFLNAKEIEDTKKKKKILLSIFDITDRRELELEKEKLLTQKDLLLKEMRHRIANSLQIIASILLLKAATVSSEEGRVSLEDAHERIMSIATVQRHLDPVARGEEIQIGAYLTALCKSLARSMIGGRKPITIEVEASEGTVPSDTAVSFGLLTTELVINSLKYAFPNGRRGTVLVKYVGNTLGWILSIEDDGVGKTDSNIAHVAGLGTSIVGALANQLHATIRTESTSKGTKVFIIFSKITS